MEVIIAAAGGAAHLAGVCAAHTVLPVLGVPMESAALKGMDSLLSTVQMPAGIPVGTLAIGDGGRAQRGAAGGGDSGEHAAELREKLKAFRAEQAEKVRAKRCRRQPLADARGSETSAALTITYRAATYWSTHRAATYRAPTYRAATVRERFPTVLGPYGFSSKAAYTVVANPGPTSIFSVRSV